MPWRSNNARQSKHAHYNEMITSRIADAFNWGAVMRSKYTYDVRALANRAMNHDKEIEQTSVKLLYKQRLAIRRDARGPAVVLIGCEGEGEGEERCARFGGRLDVG